MISPTVKTDKSSLCYLKRIMKDLDTSYMDVLDILLNTFIHTVRLHLAHQLFGVNTYF